jgi:hypothetical protein
MAKSRKTARRSATKRATKKTVRTAKLKGRKVAKPRRAKAKSKGLLAGAMDAVREATGLRRRMDRNTFEGQ